MKSFDHYNVRSIEEAQQLLNRYKGKGKLNAGGTDLLGAMRDMSIPEYPAALINIKPVKELASIKEDTTGLSIGALTKLSTIAASPVVQEKYPMLAQAARSVATPGIRNMATIGGNLAQDIRCWYYRYPEQIGGTITCLRKGGKVCDALHGDHRYHSIFGAAPLKEYPCAGNCPAHTTIPAYLTKVKEGNYEEAAKMVLECNPIPAMTGRVCPIFCEPNCNRKDLDDVVAIRCVERSVGDYILENKDSLYAIPGTSTGKSVAVVGSGPAGLSAAFYLRRIGHAVTVYEKLPNAGGMLTHAIPPYRLPKNIVKQQIEALTHMGIIFKTGTDVDKTHLTRLVKEFDAVFVATGTWKERPLGIDGEEYALSGLEFLKNVNTGKRNIPGQKVAVIGGGNVAIDVARTLLRLGAKPVILYRRTEKEMPALQEEVKKAFEEGITCTFLTLPVKMEKTEKDLAITCVKMKLGGRDASGRRSVAAMPGSEKVMHFDAVMKAIGEEADTSLLPSDVKDNLFTGGDFATGPSTVIEAVAGGRKGAEQIQAFLLAGSWKSASGNGSPFVNPSSVVMPRVNSPELSVSERIKNLDVEDASGISRQAAEEEAKRCYNCSCLAVNPSDVAVALVALDASIITTHRTIRAESFFTAHATESTLLAADEIITGISVPTSSERTRQNYIKLTLRKPVDFSLVTAATVLTVKNDGVCTHARIVMGAVAGIPLRAVTAEEYLLGRKITPETAEEAGRIALAEAHPLSGNAYKVAIARTLVKRAILGENR